MIDIWEALKTFFTSPWLEHLIFYLFLAGLAISIILVVMLIIKTYKQDIKNKKERRKRDKNLLKFISKKTNKTY
jgi:heme exporter protein D